MKKEGTNPNWKVKSQQPTDLKPNRYWIHNVKKDKELKKQNGGKTNG